MTNLSTLIPNQGDATQKSQNLSDLASTQTAYANLKRPQTKTSAYTAVAGDVIDADTSSSAWTLTLPASPADGDTVQVNDAFRSWTTNNLTIARNGKTIVGLSEDITCVKGGVGHLFTYKSATGDWKAVSFAVTGGTDANEAMVKLETQTASNSASLDFTTGFDSSLYGAYRIIMSNLVPATDGAGIRARLTTDGGSTWDSGSTDYKNVREYGYASNSQGVNEGDVDRIDFSGSQGNATTGELSGLCGEILVTGLHDSGVRTTLTSHTFVLDSSSLDIGSFNNSRRLTEQAENGIQFFYSSGNITSGSITLYGLKK